MAQESESRDLDKVIVRLPDGMRDRLKAAAENNRRSMNAEIVARIQEYEDLGLNGESLTAFVERKEKELDHLRRTAVRLPQGLFYRVDDAAIRRKRSVHEEIVQALEAAYPAPVLPEIDEVGAEWYWKYADASPTDRDAVIEAANADMKARGWPYHFWAGEPRDDGTPTLQLGVRRYGPLSDK